MAWRVAESLDVLLRELNARAPGRNKKSDGSIGDAAHASRSSDHNPYIVVRGTGVVRARDFTHDPAGGLDCQALWAHLLRLGRGGDKRLRYLIWNRQIASASGGWQVERYYGPNPHAHHLHVSVTEDARYFDSTLGWGWSAAAAIRPAPAAPLSSEAIPLRFDAMKTLRAGDSGPDVTMLQAALNHEAYRASGNPARVLDPIDGDFGPATDARVKMLQNGNGLDVDGIAGPATWAVLSAAASR